jgi:hypothetical protein
MEMYNGTLASIEEGEIVKSRSSRSARTWSSSTSASSPKGRSRSKSSRTCPTSRPATRSRSCSSTSRTGRLGRPVQEEGRLHARVGAHPRRVRERRAGGRHARQEDQGWRGRRPHGRRRVPPGLADRAPPRPEHRRAARPEVRVQDHQAQQAPPQHRRLAPRDPRDRARRQAREADEGARQGPGAEGRRQEHHRLRRVHRPRRRGRPAPHHRHVVGPHLASERDGPDRHGARGQGPRHRLGARAHLARPQAAPGVSVEGRRRQVPGRHARQRQGRLDHQLRRVHRAASRASKASCTSAR